MSVEGGPPPDCAPRSPLVPCAVVGDRGRNTDRLETDARVPRWSAGTFCISRRVLKASDAHTVSPAETQVSRKEP